MHTLEQASPPSTMSAAEYLKVRAQLERVLESHQFRNSRRYPALLRFLVEEALDGRGEYLKERLIGIHVFGRPADYDTASDPIVRVTVAEIRKRIAQYYYDEEHDAEIRIELVTGRYAPEFRLRRENKPNARPAEFMAPEADVEETAVVPPMALPVEGLEMVPEAPPMLRRPITWRRALLPAAIVLLLAFATPAGLRWLRPSALDQLWAPILSSRQTVLFCLPSSVGYKKAFSAFLNKTGIEGGPGVATAAPTFLDHESLGENVVYSDMLAMLSMANVLTAHHIEYHVRLNVATTLDDLRHGPTILIGGLDNEWTLRALEGLPYRFAGSDEEGFWISSRNDPGNRQWSLDLKMKYAAVTRDYALIARLHNGQTGEPEILVAGIGMSGTAAAGEMVGNEQLMQEVRKRVGAGFKDHDFEVVIRTDVVNGIAGSPKIVAVSVW